MTKVKSTKRALLASGLALFMCISMFVGSTFAWFTDSAKTGVNTIQAGTLDIVLEYKDANGVWQDAEGKTLAFKDMDSNTYWEPGCTYELPAIRVRNNGNLALKYQMVINGVTGNAKLLEAIEFTANNGAISNFIGHLDAKDDASEAIVIKGHMKETAGNEYQGLTLEGIGITVYATQYTYEKDSFDNKYDQLGDGQYMNGTFAAGPINSGRFMGNNGRYQIAADITKVSGVKTLAVNVLDQNGNLMTTITPEGYQIPDDGKINSLTVAAVVVGDSSSWQNTAFVPTMKSVPTTMELVVNGAVIGITDVKPLVNASPVTWEDVVAAYCVANNITVIDSADDLVDAFANLKAGDVLSIVKDIDMSGKTITPVTGNKGFILNGNGYTIKNLETTKNALFVNNSGSAAYTFDGVVLENCAVNSTTNYGALFVGDGDTSDAITIKNCVVKNCTVKSSKYAAAFVGYTAGWDVVNDGPVYSDVLIENCSVIGGSITGGGSVGAAIAHAGGNVDTTNTITGLKVDGVAINGEDAAHTGIVVGTANVGKTIISGTTYTGVTGNYNTATVLYGRFVPNSTGTLTIDGVAK